jgi:protein ImuA
MFHEPVLTRPALPAFLAVRPAVHELRAPEGTAAHMGLAALLLAGCAGGGPVLWVGTAPDWYPPGLAWAGIDPARCLFAQAADDEEALGSAETALRGGMAGVVACRELPRLAARRLALAARRGNALGLVLRHAPARTAQDSTAFASRWMVHPAPGSPYAARLRAELLYAKGAMPGVYLFEMREEQNGAAPPLVAPMRRAG